MAANGDSPAIGIDLGTTYSCVAVWRSRDDRVEIIPNDQGNRTTPSYVSFTETERLVGDAAKNLAAMNPVNTVFGPCLKCAYVPEEACFKNTKIQKYGNYGNQYIISTQNALEFIDLCSDIGHGHGPGLLPL